MSKERKDLYKNNINSLENKRRERAETAIKLRKDIKNDHLEKRRGIDSDSALQESNGQSPCQKTPEEILFGMNSSDSDLNFEAVQATRKMLSRERHPPIDLIISSGIVPKLVGFLDRSDEPNLQFEAAWALTNIASGSSEQTMAVVDAGAIHRFIWLLSSPTPNVAEQAVWALGNIAGDGSKTRDIVLNANVVEGLIQLISTDLPISSLRNITWLMSNLFRNKNPSAPFDKVEVMLPHLARLLEHEDSQVVTDAALAISYVTDDDNIKIQAVIDHGCVQPLVKLLEREDPSVIVPSLRGIGNIVTGNDQQISRGIWRETDAVLAAGALTPLNKLLQCTKMNIVKEAAWTISNITAGNSDQIEQVINADVFPIISRILDKGDFKSQKEAAWIITNTTTSGTPQQEIKLVTRFNVFIPFCMLMDSKDARTVNVVLSGLVNILDLADKHGGTDEVCQYLEEHNCVELLEKLQNHENEDIYKRSLHIIEKYFNEEQESDLNPGEMNGDLHFDPHNNGQNGYSF